MTSTTRGMGVTPQEATHIRSQLNLRYNKQQGCWEVYTTMLSSGGLFQWIQVSPETMNWYLNKFPEIVSRMSDADWQRYCN